MEKRLKNSSKKKSSKNYIVEQIIIAKLRKAELQCSQEIAIAEACKGVELTEQSFYRWLNRIRRDEPQRCAANEGTSKKKHAFEEAGRRASVGRLISQGCECKKLLRPAKRLASVKYVAVKQHAAGKRACRVLQINRNSCRYLPVKRDDKDEIRKAIIRLVPELSARIHRKVGRLAR